MTFFGFRICTLDFWFWFDLGLDNSIFLNSANFLIGAQGKGSNIFSLQKWSCGLRWWCLHNVSLTLGSRGSLSLHWHWTEGQSGGEIGMGAGINCWPDGRGHFDHKESPGFSFLVTSNLRTASVCWSVSGWLRRGLAHQADQPQAGWMWPQLGTGDRQW